MDIYSLLKSGRLESLHLGSDLEKSVKFLERSFAEEGVIESEMNGVTVVAAGAIEAHFLERQLINLILKLSHYSSKSYLTLGAPDRKLNRKTSLDGMVQLLDRAKIEWKVCQKYCQDRRVELITEGSMGIEFLAERSRFVVNRMHLTDGDTYSEA